MNYKKIVSPIIVCLVMFSGCIKKRYESEVKAALKIAGEDTLKESDIDHLPGPVKKYLRYTGAINKSKVHNFKIVFEGGIRKDSTSAWMKFTSQQYNFLEFPTRLFYMKASMKGLPVRGFHCYKDGKAFMDIRLFSLFKVQYQEGKEMDISETVTFFNDMCCMAPATLIDKRIRWQQPVANSVKADFTHENITISATLYFNDLGQLVNFVSEDRYALMKDKTMKKLRWSTPLKNYKMINGQHMPGYAETIYTYPEGDFCYGTFELISAEYNCKY